MAGNATRVALQMVNLVPIAVETLRLLTVVIDFICTALDNPKCA